MSEAQNFGEVLDKAPELGDYEIIEWTVDQARGVIDAIPDGAGDDAGDLATAIDSAQGNATPDAPRYVVIKIAPAAEQSPADTNQGDAS